MAYSNDYKRTIRGRAMTLISNARKRSKLRDVPLELSSEWVEDKLAIGTCQITGIPFNLEPTPEHVTRRWDAPSLDRINKHLPYNEENTRVVLWAVNCALSEYGTEIMLPILKAMVKGIEDAGPQPTTSVPTGYYPKSKVSPQLGFVFTTGTGEDDDNPNHHSGANAGKDVDHSTQESSGDSVAHRNRKVEPSRAFTRIEDNGDSEPEIVRLEFGRRYLFD